MTMDIGPLLCVRGLERSYSERGSHRELRVLKGVTFDLDEGQALGIVGLSGAGKSTLCRLLLGLEAPDGGTISFEGAPLALAGPRNRRGQRGRIQAVFQDPRSSLNPSLSIGAIVAEPLLARTEGTRQTRSERVGKALRAVKLSPEISSRRPSQLSGGERQRVAIARALVAEPKLVILDEPVSALDAVVRRDVLALLADLKTRLNLSMIFVSHDVRSVSALAERCIVLHNGAVVEEGPTSKVFGSPTHPFTRKLVAAVPARLPVAAAD